VKFFIVKTDVGVVNNRFKFQILLTARICSTILATSLSKLLVSTTGSGFIVTLFGYTACSIVIATVAFLQATDVDQNLFFPASACGIQVVNAGDTVVGWIFHCHGADRLWRLPHFVFGKFLPIGR
jgi:hypothetical protein